MWPTWALHGRRLGLYHGGWMAAASITVWQQKKAQLKALGVTLDGEADHRIGCSLYCRHPNGNENELYVDNPD